MLLRHTGLKLAIAAALLASTGVALAASQSANLAVSASVTQNCTITTAALSFGAYDPVVANAATALNATGSVNVACTKGASSLTIGMDNGAHVSGAQRQMLGGTSAGNLQYNLFQPPTNTAGAACTFPGTTAWTTAGAGLLAITSPATKAARTYNVCGTIPAGQDVPADASYTDTVSATINF
jgi:spore coat protein U-like protein